MDSCRDAVKDFVNICDPVNIKPEDFIGYEDEIFKVVGVDLEKQEMSVVLKGQVTVTTFNIDDAINALAEVKGGGNDEHQPR